MSRASVSSEYNPPPIIRHALLRHKITLPAKNFVPTSTKPIDIARIAYTMILLKEEPDVLKLRVADAVKGE